MLAPWIWDDFCCWFVIDCLSSSIHRGPWPQHRVRDSWKAWNPMIFPPVMTRIGGWCCTAAALGWRKGTPSSAITQLTVSEGSSTFLLTFYVTIIPFDTCVFFLVSSDSNHLSDDYGDRPTGSGRIGIRWLVQFLWVGLMTRPMVKLFMHCHPQNPWIRPY